MEIEGFQTVDSIPGLYHPELELIVISDLHLGLEGSMTFDGNYVPKHQLEKLLKDIEKMKEETDASRIIVNGDLKNEFKTRYSETDEIENFLGFLDREFEEIILIEGNHDTFLEETVEDYGLELQEYHLEDDILFTHGHLELEELEAESFETVVIGHEHPALALEDEIGIREKVACFLYGDMEDKRILVLPAFSSISNGTNVNETPQSQLLSPIMRDHVNKNKLKAVAVSREAGIFKFPEIGKI
ncbi:MAG: metallophosphoesterase [Nanohaloarchaea archaeon]|nr:metallophosphoesterase [Candidatus Nanohaloarchaea archaeon]